MFPKYLSLPQQAHTHLFSFVFHFQNFWWLYEVLRFQYENFWFFICFHPYLFSFSLILCCDLIKFDPFSCVRIVILLTQLILLRFILLIDWFGDSQFYIFFLFQLFHPQFLINFCYMCFCLIEHFRKAFAVILTYFQSQYSFFDILKWGYLLALFLLKIANIWSLLMPLSFHRHLFLFLHFGFLFWSLRLFSFLLEFWLNCLG